MKWTLMQQNIVLENFVVLFKYLFDSTLQSGIFPDLMKIVFKTGDTADVSNYPPISVSSFFSQKSLDA